MHVRNCPISMYCFFHFLFDYANYLIAPAAVKLAGKYKTFNRIITMMSHLSK
jgi:hypothetical protein